MKFRVILVMTLLLQAPVNAQQPAVHPATQAQTDAAVAEARTKNRQYWKMVKLVTLGGAVAALLLMRLRSRRRR